MFGKRRRLTIELCAPNEKIFIAAAKELVTAGRHHLINSCQRFMPSRRALSSLKSPRILKCVNDIWRYPTICHLPQGKHNLLFEFEVAQVLQIHRLSCLRDLTPFHSPPDRTSLIFQNGYAGSEFEVSQKASICK